MAAFRERSRRSRSSPAVRWRCWPTARVAAGRWRDDLLTLTLVPFRLDRKRSSHSYCVVAFPRREPESISAFAGTGFAGTRTMNQADALDIVQADRTIILASGRRRGSAGRRVLVLALFQALTQVQEVTLTFIPKILAILLVTSATALHGAGDLLFRGAGLRPHRTGFRARSGKACPREGGDGSGFRPIARPA